MCGASVKMKRSSREARAVVGQACVVIVWLSLAGHCTMLAFGLVMIACAEVAQAEGNRAGRNGSRCRARSVNPQESLRTCRRGAGYRAEARSCMLGQYVAKRG